MRTVVLLVIANIFMTFAWYGHLRHTTSPLWAAILGHVLGSKEASRQVAAGAAQKTGIDPSVLKQMLPIVAAMVMGGLSRQSKTAGLPTSDPRAAGSGIGAMLGPLLDRDRDGSGLTAHQVEDDFYCAAPGRPVRRGLTWSSR